MHLVITMTFLALLALSFVVFFLKPAISHRARLTKLIARLDSPDFKDERNPDQLALAFNGDVHLSRLWDEYSKTLYDALPSASASGIVVPEWRSTEAAESFWNGSLAVDARVSAEFFKHVPGLFTGIGIIGTFSGLILGLGQFNVSENPAAVRISLESLMKSVGDAFYISAFAISAAMIATFLEKILLTSLYSKIDKIAQILDSKFTAAAAEKFLEQTASHTEESATQLKQLKSELLKDLTPILHELSDKQSKMLEGLANSFQQKISDVAKIQIDATRENSNSMAGAIAGAITNGLAGPLGEIKDAVKQASGDQSAGATKMLQDVMVSFSQKLNDLFGGQISGINELNQRSAQLMQDAVSKLSELVVSLQDAGKNSTNAMADQMAKALSDMAMGQAAITSSTHALVGELKAAIEQSHTTTSASVQNSSDEMARRMAEAVEKMEQRQDSINERTREFVEQIKVLVSNTQSDTSAKVQSTLQSLGDQLGVMLGQFQSAQQSALTAGQQREASTASKTEQAVGALTTRSTEFVTEVGQLLSKTQADNSASLQSTVQAMGEQVAVLLSEFQAVQQTALQNGRQREEQTASRTQEVVSTMVESVEALVKEVAVASALMQDSITALTATSTRAISGLNDGADQVNSASRNFVSASDKVSGAMSQAATVTTRLTELTTHMTAAATALQQGIQDYSKHRESVSQLVSELNELVANAKTDVSITSNVLNRIEQATAKLSTAQLETEKFMHGVAEVLATAHQEFRSSVSNSLSHSNHEFQQKLSAGVSMLSSSIKDLDEVLGSISPIQNVNA